MTGDLSFWKMEGAGNDFVVIDAREGLPRPPDELARRLCARGTGVGADGLLAITEAQPGRAVVDYRNADGSSAAFCGNGARCAARFAVERGLSASPLELVFPGFTVEAVVDGAMVAIRASRPSVDEAPLSLPLPDGGALPGRLVRAGVPHVVAREPAGARLSLPALAERLFAANPELAGTVNVTLVREASDRTIFVRTLERGSGETLACGSAAWAAAVFCETPPGAGGRFEILPPAGIPLTVELAPAGGSAVLSGPARIVFRGLLAEW
jgi:diaminopimelate epimerase